MARILVVDDELSILEFFRILLEKEEYEVDTVSSGKEAIEIVNQKPYDLVISDLSMPEVDGMAVLRHVREVSPETMVLIVTAYATAESAVEAMKVGAYDYLTKPFKVDEIRLVVRNALEKRLLKIENSELKKEVHRRKGFDHFIGQSPNMARIFDLVDKVAGGRSSVLIIGESGVGKELVAKAIHENSPRAGRPFISINCAAIPETLMESELFGYQRGAFTGATSNKMGLFEAAHQGTFFLDEVGDLPPAIQGKFLRVLQEKSVRRIGSTVSVAVDVRIVAATNRDLENDVATGRFREDLYFRLNVIQIRVPPLRDRREDIPLLAEHFLVRATKEHGKTVRGFTPAVSKVLIDYDYPGNVRELENIVEQAVALEGSDLVVLESLPEKVRGKGKDEPADVSMDSHGIDLERVLGDYEKRLLMDALKVSGGIKKKAAELLKISFRSMRYRLIKHGIDAGDDPDDLNA